MANLADRYSPLLLGLWAVRKRWIASGSDDKTIKLWNLETGSAIRTLQGHDAYVLSVSFSPDGKTLASGSADKTIKLWNLDLLSLDALRMRNCNLVGAYLKKNPKVSENDRHLCDDVPKVVAEGKSS